MVGKSQYSCQKRHVKNELHALNLQNKQRLVRYVIDEILAAKRHNIIHLPPYHPKLNSVESSEELHTIQLLNRKMPGDCVKIKFP